MQTKELAGVVIYNDQGELLLIHRNTQYLSQWELPGGKIEKNESIQEAAVREALEEISVDVTVGDIIGNASFEDRGILWNYTWLLANVVDDQKPEIGEPHTFDGLAYFSIDDLRKKDSDISPNLINLLKVIK